MDAATLKVSPPRASVALGQDFRIFMDAATLKEVRAIKIITHDCHFRIFMDAATLKAQTAKNGSRAIMTNFRIFMDAATLKVQVILSSKTHFWMISASLWMRPH